MQNLRLILTIILFVCGYNSYSQRLDIDKVLDSGNFHDTIQQLWLKCKPNINLILNTANISSNNLYQVQIRTNVLLRYAFINQDYQLIDDMLSVYMKAATKVKYLNKYTFSYWDKNSNKRESVFRLDNQYPMWIDGNDTINLSQERILAISQFLALISDAIFNIALIPPQNRTKTMYLFVDTYSKILDSHYERWILGMNIIDKNNNIVKAGPFQRRGWDCRYDGIYTETRLSHNQLIDLLLENKCGNGSSPKYCNSITDTDLWIIAGISSYLAAYYLDKTLVKTVSHPDFYKDVYLPKAIRLIESRINVTRLTDFSGNYVWGADFDTGSSYDHPDNKFAGYTNQYIFPTNSNFAPVENLGWDLSHARRFVNVLQTLYQTKDYLGLNFPGENILKMFANQFAYKVFNGDFEYPLFSNYFDGTNGWYRVDYDKRKNFGYGPSDMSITAYSGGFMFWKDYNPDIKIIANSLYALIHTSNQEKLDFLNQRYEKNYWTNRTTTNLPIRVQSIFFKNNVLEVDNISTRFTLLSFYASLAIPNKKSSPLNSIPDPVNLYPNPAKDQAIVISEKKITEISVYDLSGNLLYRKNHNNSIVSISLNEFSSGTYIVVIKDENNSISRKKLTVL